MATADDFAAKAASDIAGLAISVMAGLGDRLGLFKTLAASPATSVELSERAGISERYAREWLRGMAAAGYLVRKPGEVYELPASHVPILAAETNPMFIGGTLAMAMEMLNVIPHLESAFRSGAGIDYSLYRPGVFSEFERDMGPTYTARLVGEWIGAIPDVAQRLERGADAVDIGTGGGLVPVLLAQAFPKSRFYGYDIHGPSVDRARRNASEAGVADRVRFEVVDPSEGLPRTFDLVTTFDVIHDSAKPDQLLKSIHSAVAPAGVYLCMEQRVPPFEQHGRMEATRYAYSLLYCMSTSLAAGGPGWGTLGADLETFTAACRGAGFSNVQRVIDDELYELFLVRP
jgi:SAM-dependent methyltransferase